MTAPTIFGAVRSNDVAGVEHALENDPNAVHRRSDEGLTPLHIAAEHAGPAVVAALLDAGASPRETTPWGMTALEWAATLGRREVGEVLIAKGGEVTFWIAAGLGRLGDVKRLHEGASVRELLRADPVTADPKGWPPETAFAQGDGLSDAFHSAARNGWVDVAAYLLGVGADIDARGYFGATALQWAAHLGHEDVVRWLVEHGANVELRDPQFDATAAGWAREGGHTEIADYLQGSLGATSV
jgi:ankyrin repeat protein